jgi:hypothetical protein
MPKSSFKKVIYSQSNPWIFYSILVGTVVFLKSAPVLFKTMKKNILIILGVLAILLAVFATVLYSGDKDSKIITFAVEKPDLGQPNFVVTSQKLTAVEILGLPEGAAKNKYVSLGKMDLVEKNEQGAETWVMAVPEQPQKLTEVIARGFNEKNRVTSQVTLPIKGTSAITTTLWPTETRTVLTGTVKSFAGKTISLSVPIPQISANATITVTLADKATVVDQKGKPTTVSQIKKGAKISVLGDYTDDASFTATQVELSK